MLWVGEAIGQEKLSKRGVAIIDLSGLLSISFLLLILLILQSSAHVNTIKRYGNSSSEPSSTPDVLKSEIKGSLPYYQ
jgi:hypothetical protein